MVGNPEDSLGYQQGVWIAERVYSRGVQWQGLASTETQGPDWWRKIDERGMTKVGASESRYHLVWEYRKRRWSFAECDWRVVDPIPSRTNEVLVEKNTVDALMNARAKEKRIWGQKSTESTDRSPTTLYMELDHQVDLLIRITSR